MNSTLLLKHHISMGGSQLAKISKKQPPKTTKVKKEEHELDSLIGRDIITHLSKKHVIKETVLHLKSGEKNIEIKTINIQQVVKKFAYSVFEEVNIDPKTGK